MKTLHAKAAIGAAIIGAISAAAWAFAPPEKPSRNTPPNWSYEVRNGQRVPRVPRTINPDGSWTEQYKAGNCMVTRTGRNGEIRETRKCD